jgi:hypothetical protein
MARYSVNGCGYSITTQWDSAGLEPASASRSRGGSIMNFPTTPVNAWAQHGTGAQISIPPAAVRIMYMLWSFVFFCVVYQEVAGSYLIHSESFRH